MMGSGIHIVWGIFRVFDLYRCHEENSFYLRFVIWSWYFGAIIGNCVGGRVVQTMRKGHLYVSYIDLLPNYANLLSFFTKLEIVSPSKSLSCFAVHMRCDAYKKRYAFSVVRWQ